MNTISFKSLPVNQQCTAILYIGGWHTLTGGLTAAQQHLHTADGIKFQLVVEQCA